jgi:hypothetical protein
VDGGISLSGRNLVGRRAAPVLLCALLAVCLFYQAYRYPFQINSSRTSPTYSDTPSWLQLGKWGLIAAIALALAVLVLANVRSVLRNGSRLRLVALALEVALVVLTIVRIAVGADSVEPWVFLVGAGTALVVTLTSDVHGRASVVIARVIVVYAVVCIVAEVVQVALYLIADRLPALAYADSPSVRFGSVLDDPNGFAVVIAALIPTVWFTLSARPNLRLVLVIGLLCCLPLTQSWTGVTGTVFALSVTYLLTHGLVRDLRRAAAVVTAAVIVVGVAAFFARSTIAELIRLKQGSVESHAAAFEHIVPDTTTQETAAPLASATPDATPVPTATVPSAAASAPLVQAPPVEQLPHATWTGGIESSYVNLLVNYGPVLLVAYIALGVIAVVLLLRGWTRLPMALRTGAAAYLICFLLASANLGLDRTFPCNVLYFVFCGLAYATSTPLRGLSDLRPATTGSAQDASTRRRSSRAGRARRRTRGARVLDGAI